MNISVHPGEIKGDLRAPGSKSVMQRAVAAGLLAEGQTNLRQPAECEDCSAAIGVARDLGAGISIEPGLVRIRGGFPGPAGFSPRPTSLDCGESGLCIRMFTPVAALADFSLTLSGHGSLVSRPLGALEAPLRELGAECETRSGFAPVRVRGPLKGGSCAFDGSLGSQILTGLLTALPTAERDSVIRVVGLTSRPYIDLTIKVLADFGVAVAHENYSRFTIAGRQRYRPRDYEIEADWSGAAFLLAAGLTASTGGVLVSGLDPETPQADSAMLEAMTLAGADFSLSPEGAPGGGILVRKSELKGFEFDATDCPDLFPPLAALAAYCSGPTRLHGARRLAHKESDRAKAIRDEFAAVGIAVEVDGDIMTIRPGPILGGVMSSRGDHRMAMAAALLGLGAESPVTILGAECVAKSYPGFFDDIARLGADCRPA